ncbi:hypothetical protein K0M31_016703 [Melipona bicolor]|uniref:Uncharacterized protein n=1 Tax=Melipona bicolor TaxID=60889 RepID=A0AA40FE60_9HYME|nr:hypothetical protein K0M31_016703 [Melipona bicolor]
MQKEEIWFGIRSFSLTSTINNTNRDCEGFKDPGCSWEGRRKELCESERRKRLMRFVSESLPRLISGTDGSDFLPQTLVVITNPLRLARITILAGFRILLALTSEMGRTSTLGAQPLAACASRVFESRSRGIVGPLHFLIFKMFSFSF